MRLSAVDGVFEAGGLRFVRLGGGALAIGHRPPLRAVKRMHEGGVTHIVTVLAESEQPELIGAAARAAGLEWKWIVLGSTKNLPARALPAIKEALRSLVVILEEGGRIYLHCSAGIHRTGMIAAALLYHLGRAPVEVEAALEALRPVTAADVGAARMDWARSFAMRSDDPSH